MIFFQLYFCINEYCLFIPVDSLLPSCEILIIQNKLLPIFESFYLLLKQMQINIEYLFNLVINLSYILNLINYGSCFNYVESFFYHPVKIQERMRWVTFSLKFLT